MGVKLNCQANPLLEYACAVKRVSRNVVKRMVRPHHWNSFVYENFSASGRQNRRDLKTVHDFTRSVIEARKAEILAHEKAEEEANKVAKKKKILRRSSSFFETRKRPAFLDLILHLKDSTSGANWPDSAIQEEVETLMVAGHESTAMTLTWTLFLLGNYPEVQAKLQEELDQFWEEEGLDFDPIFYATFFGKQVKGLEYLNAVIKESLRLYPPAPIIGRIAKMDIPVNAGNQQGHQMIIPKGSSILLFLYNIHRDATVYERPELFNPERFLPVRGRLAASLEHPYAFIPFSAGPRSCIGAKLAMVEVAMMLALIVHSFTVVSEKKVDEVGVIPEITLRPDGPVGLCFTSRKF